MMKPLLDTSSPLYLKRLARELNSLPDGFYSNGIRYIRAKTETLKGELRLKGRTIGETGKGVWYWLEPETSGMELSDAYGRTVCASRKA